MKLLQGFRPTSNHLAFLFQSHVEYNSQSPNDILTFRWEPPFGTHGNITFHFTAVPKIPSVFWLTFGKSYKQVRELLSGVKSNALSWTLTNVSAPRSISLKLTENITVISNKVFGYSSAFCLFSLNFIYFYFHGYLQTEIFCTCLNQRLNFLLTGWWEPNNSKTAMHYISSVTSAHNIAIHNTRRDHRLPVDIVTMQAGADLKRSKYRR